MNEEEAVIVCSQILWEDLSSYQSSVGNYFWTIFMNYNILNDNKSIYSVLLSSLIREDHIKIADYYKSWIEKYISFDFYTHFRMEKDTFVKLSENIGPFFNESRKKSIGGRPQVPLSKCILMTLWYLAKNDLICSISDRFNVALSTCCTVMAEIVEYICKLHDTFISWPSPNDCKIIAGNFQRLHGFPNVIGAIDGCRIKVKVPSIHHDSYLDRKFNYSIAIQAVCTAEKLFTNIYVGFPGAAHDARILTSSAIYRMVQSSPENLFYSRYHLLGDSAYPCKTWLLTPYRNVTNLPEVAKNYNRIHSATRVKIEHSFGLLTERWLILKFINVYSIEKAVKIITSCCILHNFCLLEKDFFDMEDKPDDRVVVEENVEDLAGSAKRDDIANTLYITNKRRRLN